MPSFGLKEHGIFEHVMEKMIQQSYLQVNETIGMATTKKHVNLVMLGNLFVLSRSVKWHTTRSRYRDRKQKRWFTLLAERGLLSF